MPILDAAVEIPWALEVLKALTYLESQSVTRHIPLHMSGRAAHFVVSKCYPLVRGFNTFLFYRSLICAVLQHQKNIYAYAATNKTSMLHRKLTFIGMVFWEELQKRYE